MRKEDLKYGNVVEFESGSRYIYTFDNLRGEEDKQFFLRLDFVSDCQRDVILRSHISSDLIGNEDSWLHKGVKIMKVYEDYTCSKVLWERKKKPELTDDAETCLKILYAAGYRYIARDGRNCSFGSKDNSVWVYKNKPRKDRCTSRWEPDFTKGVCGDEITINLTTELKEYTGCFSFVKWEDKEPYSIAYLLEESEVNE